MMERNITIEGNVLLAGRGLYGGDDLAGNTQLGEGSESGKPVVAEIADGFEQADHPFLNDVFVIGSNQKVAPGLALHQVAVLDHQVFGGALMAVASILHNLFVPHVVKP